MPSASRMSRGWSQLMITVCAATSTMVVTRNHCGT